MAIKKIVVVGEEKICICASAAFPRQYKLEYGRDIYKDLKKLSQSLVGVAEVDIENMDSIEILEEMVYLMVKKGDSSTPETIELWLENFTTEDIIGAMPEILEHWSKNMGGSIELKKNLVAPIGK